MLMEDTVKHKRCNKSECEVTITGACAEGHDPLESCPFYGKDSEINDYSDEDFESAAEEFQQDAGESDLIELPSSEALDVVQVDEFLRWRPIRLITIVGDRDSGKTTLICSIYERFLRGPFADHLFAGSRTLIGFDQRHHYSRVDSGLDRPDTPRTSLSDGVRFYHFAVVRENEHSVRTDLMLSDRAGEKYQQARNNSIVVSELFEVAKADRLVLLLDGARLISKVERANACTSVRLTLRALLDGGALDNNIYVQIVITKIDRIENQVESEKTETREYLFKFQQKLLERFNDRVAELSFFEISARDPDGKLPPAFGIDKLLKCWVDKTHRITSTIGIRNLPLKSEFDLLLARTPMEVVP